MAEMISQRAHLARLLISILVVTLTAVVSSSPATAAPSSGAQAGDEHSSEWDAEPVASSVATTQPCADLLFVGVRGSGETAPYGNTVTGVRDDIARQWDDAGSVRQVYLDYPAAPVESITTSQIESLLLDAQRPAVPYFDSAQEGVTQLRAVLEDSAARCPTEAVALVGFSQGAQVITQALAADPSPTRLGGVLLMGNPDHFPADNAVELDGQVDTAAMGLDATLTYLRTKVGLDAAGSGPQARAQTVPKLLGTVFDLHTNKVDNAEIATAMRNTGRSMPPDVYPVTWSVCQVGDMVCDSVAALSSVLTGDKTFTSVEKDSLAIHLGYKGAVIAQSVDAMAQSLKAVVQALHPAPGQEATPTGGTETSENPAIEPLASTAPWDVTAAMRWVYGAVGLAVGVTIGLIGGRALGRGRRRSE